MLEPPRICLWPKGIRDFLKDAIVAGKGTLVEPDQAEALIWTDSSDPNELRQMLDDHPSLRWVQLPWAGIEPFLEVLDHDRIWTAGKGVYAEPVAEHALGLALAGFRNIAGYARAKSWSAPVGTSLHGANVTILGAGGIMTSLLRLLEPFDCRVTVVRRKNQPVDGVELTATLSELASIFPTTDLLVIALSLTAETTHIIDKSRLAMLPNHAWIVNVARGKHVVTDDLVDALRDGVIAGAALDVTDPEPLPSAHPLWKMPQCIITPHIGNTPEMAVPMLSRRVSENVRRFGAGEQLIGIVDVSAGY